MATLSSKLYGGRRAARGIAVVMVASALVWSGGSTASAGDSAGAVAGSRRGAAASLSAGGEHTCALLNDQTISCWGSDGDGQVGNGAPTGDYQTPQDTPLPSGRSARAIAVGGVNSCVVLDDQRLTCWGLDDSGQVGDGPENNNLSEPDTIIDIPETETVISVAVNLDFSCGVFSSGTIRCWGSDDDGQLGNGGADVGVDGADVDTIVNAPIVALPGAQTASAVTAGRTHTCAVLDNATISCWGANDDGQLGTGSSATVVTSPSATVTMPGGGAAVGVSAGGEHTCALLDDGDITCWGKDADGQLGNGGGAADVGQPSATVSLPGPAVAVATGRAHTCAVLADDRLFCWGDDSQGQVGSAGPNADANSPVEITVGGSVQAVALGDDHTCALLDNGSVTCWGSDSAGQLGNGVAGSTSVPTGIPIAGLVVAENAGTSSAPRSVVAVGGRESAQLSWNAPLDDGGEPITGYLIQQSVDGGTTWVTVIADTSSTATSATVSPALSSATARFRVAAINAVGASPYSQPSAAVVIDPLTDLKAFTPIRLLDTRNGGETIDGEFEKTGPINGVQFLRVPIAGRGGADGVPANAPAAVLNVTAINSDVNGFATVYPCGTRPNASTLNFPAKRNVANAVVAKLDADGFVCLFTSVTAQFILDATGYVPSGSRIDTVDPVRLLDTRPTGETIDGLRQREGTVAGGTFIEVQIAGRSGSGVPASADAALLNVTAVNPTAKGFATVYPCGTRPNASSVNFDAGVNKANAVVSKLTDSGTVCIFVEQTTNVLIDVSGYATDASLTPITPGRLLDTRPNGETIDGAGLGSDFVPAGTRIVIDVAGRPGVDADATLVALSVVAANSDARGFLTVYPCTAQPPLASTLNYEAGQNVANLALTSVSASGQVCVFTSATAQIIADVTAVQ